MSQNKRKENFTYKRSEMIFHFSFIGLNLAYVMWRVASIALQYPQYPSKQSILSQYIGIKRDCHDDQWQAYRSNLPSLIALIFGWDLTTRILSIPKTSTYLGIFLCLFSFRIDCLFYFALISGWYFTTKKFQKSKYIVPASWIFTIVLLYLNQLFDHFRPLSSLLDMLVPQRLSFMRSSQAPIHWAHIVNMSLLKLISFTVDTHRQSQHQQLKKHQEKCQECKEIQFCRKGRDYMDAPPLNFGNFLSYILFAPTFLAGPPIPYKNYHSFRKMPTSTKPQYFRWILIVVSFELFQHLYPSMAPRQDLSLIDAELISLFALVFIWYKFLIIWKTARLWSLICGIDVADNMSRCLFNNYGFEGFWRMWHRGYNLWLIRYLYVPLGGKNNFISVIAVIAFVAFWHDHTIKIVLWAFILVLFMVPEIAAKRFFSSNFRHLYPKMWFKYFSAVVSAVYIYFICIANLIGFGFGHEKSYILLEKLVKEWPSTIYSVIVLSSAVTIMFYIRHREGNTRNY